MGGVSGEAPVVMGLVRIVCNVAIVTLLQVVFGQSSLKEVLRENALSPTPWRPLALTLRGHMILAQITDFHVRTGGRAYGVVNTATCLAAAVARLSALDPQPDLVVATGDLTDSGRPEEYELLREILRPLATPVYLMPGNHDDRETLRQAFRGYGYFPAAGFLNYVVEAPDLRLVALDTVVTGEGGGMLCAARLDWLERELRAAPERATAISMHHPPFRSGIAHMDAIGLDGADAFAALLARHPQVKRVFCGHLHRAIQTGLGGDIVASTAPSTAHQVNLDLRADGPATFIMEPPGYQLHVWDARGACVSHTGFIDAYDGPYPFHDIAAANAR